MPSLAHFSWLAIFICAPALAELGDIGIHHPFATTADQNASMGAAYLLIHNHSGHDDRMLSASSPAARRVEIRGNSVAQDLSEGVEILAHHELELTPDGIYLAFLDLTRPWQDGDVLTLTLVFEQAGEMTFRLPVDLDRLTEAAPHEHADHGS